MRNGVDGKASEGGARLGTIGRDHLSEFGHEFGRDHQIRYNCPCGPSGHAVVGYGENEPPTGAGALNAHPRRTHRGWQTTINFPTSSRAPAQAS
jgi:hypothetical protein